MKHLKKIFESIEKLDTDYIEMCFVDYIDKGDCDVEVDNFDGRDYIELAPTLPGIEYKRNKWINKNRRNTLEEVHKAAKELLEFYDDINACVKKVKIKYPNIEVSFSIEKEGYDEDVEPFDAYIQISFMLPKNIKRIPMTKGKLGMVNLSNLEDTWDVRGEENED